MAWTVDELTRWLGEVEPVIEQRDLFTWLDLTRAALPAAIQPAFHEVARSRHPDLWRAKLSAVDHDRLVRIYARIAAAYAELRDPARCAAYAAALRKPGSTSRHAAMAPPSPASARAPGQPAQPRRASPTRPPPARPTPTPRPVTSPTLQPARTSSPSISVPRTTTQIPAATARPQPVATPLDPTAPIEPARAMNARALNFYRRAEGALRVGDRATALLQLKMAVASDPSSALLRAALRELVGVK